MSRKENTMGNDSLPTLSRIESVAKHYMLAQPPGKLRRLALWNGLYLVHCGGATAETERPVPSILVGDGTEELHSVVKAICGWLSEQALQRSKAEEGRNEK